MLARSDQAAERALDLHPDSLEAANELALHRAERGDLARAYREAQELVRRRPDSAVAHHLLSYVLRYAGVLDEAGRQCDMTTLLDPWWVDRARRHSWRLAITSTPWTTFERTSVRNGPRLTAWTFSCVREDTHKR